MLVILCIISSHHFLWPLVNHATIQPPISRRIHQKLKATGSLQCFIMRYSSRQEKTYCCGGFGDSTPTPNAGLRTKHQAPKEQVLLGTFGDSYNSHQFEGRYVFSSNNCSETIQEMLHSLLKILYLLLHKLCKQTKAKDPGTKKYCLLENLDSFDCCWLTFENQWRNVHVCTARERNQEIHFIANNIS